MPEFATFLAVIIIAAIASYSAGWFHSGYAIKRDSRKLKQAIDRSNKQYKYWSSTDAGKAYQKGYSDGVAMVLDTVDGLIARSKKNASS
jgi:phosphatidylglycerophosphate synthase